MQHSLPLSLQCHSGPVSPPPPQAHCNTETDHSTSQAQKQITSTLQAQCNTETDHIHIPHHRHKNRSHPHYRRSVTQKQITSTLQALCNRKTDHSTSTSQAHTTKATEHSPIDPKLRFLLCTFSKVSQKQEQRNQEHSLPSKDILYSDLEQDSTLTVWWRTLARTAPCRLEWCYG